MSLRSLRALPRVATNLFIAIHLVAILTWEMAPLDDWPVATVVRSYVRWVGLWQNWAMFAPDPLDVNLKVYAFVTERDGRVRSWNLAQFNDTAIWASRIRRDRYRKWVTDHVRRDDHALLWPDTARFVLRRGTEGAGMTDPVSVTLVRHWRPITISATPGLTLLPAQASEFSYVFFDYQVPGR